MIVHSFSRAFTRPIMFAVACLQQCFTRMQPLVPGKSNHPFPKLTSNNFSDIEIDLINAGPDAVFVNIIYFINL